MKQLLLLMAAAMVCNGTMAQALTDSVPGRKTDTIRIGNIVIVKKRGESDGKKDGWDSDVRMGRKKNKNSNISTNWWIIDFGISSFTDKTNYAALPGGYLANRPGTPPLGANDFKLRQGKSINVNLWFFMQKLNVIKHKLNLKYGIGLELNNYRFKSAISFKEGGPNPYPPFNNNTNAFVMRDSINFSKNKLAADYLTVPFMLNFTSHPGYRKKGISISAGVSVGYLYSQRNKQKSSERGKQKNRGDYDMERFRFSYIGELGIGPARLYASYSPQSMFKKTGTVSNSQPDFRPFNVGVRLSNW
jgi:hypothetical protein